MTRSEVALLLGLAAARDYRTVGEVDVLAWFEDIGDLDLADAREAVARHYRESTDRVMPAHIRRLVKMIRDERRREAPHEVRAIAGRFEEDVTRDLRMKRGLSECREVVGAVLERIAAGRDVDQPEPSESDTIRARALEVARAGKKGRRS